MGKTVELIAGNVKRLRESKGLFQKEVTASSKVPQGQYVRIENGKAQTLDLHPGQAGQGVRGFRDRVL